MDGWMIRRFGASGNPRILGGVVVSSRLKGDREREGDGRKKNADGTVVAADVRRFGLRRRRVDASFLR
ncbi:hypothetical protein BDA96_10G256300 [Sorghum bicolor]|uniref:Uncharacterized protein n=2 Tax=Sorghum bicolor TaxID=4558 RepID=A0A921Q5C4_SORBI|nr:hypothetical protein BDA96_10G256300 [Sorghum bicolor]OQU76728.1 hypothetical protein SORBI_3010G196466 [Sorghum bicolor]